jgi:HEAT repeat protein
MNASPLRFALVTGLLSMLGAPAAATEAEPSVGSRWQAEAKDPVPPGARLELQTDRKSYFIGENVLVHFVLKNTGSQPFTINVGGDYRGSGRPLRFDVSVNDSQENPVEDAGYPTLDMGGFSYSPEIKLGADFTQSIPLLQYRRITTPGTYKISITHDLGWKETAGLRRPVGEIVLDFKMPSPTDAEKIVSEMEQLPPRNPGSWGEPMAAYADFGGLDAPVYLEPLLRRARAGEERALEGIARMRTPESTAALVELARSPDAKIALQAAANLNRRLPSPDPGHPQGEKKHYWNTDAETTVRLLAVDFLGKKDAQSVAAGADMLRVIGTPADAPTLLEALQHAIDKLISPRRNPTDNILDQPQPVRELVLALKALQPRGYSVQEGSLNEAGLLAYFALLENVPGPRSAFWRQVVEVYSANARFPTRLEAVNSFSVPLTDNCVPLIKARLSDADIGVVRAACVVAGRSGNPMFAPQLLEIITTENHPWLLREAANAAWQLGAREALRNAWVERLPDETLCAIALDYLEHVIERVPGGSSGRTDLTRKERIALRDEWKRFLAQHADELREGKKFKLGDPALPRALFGRARTWKLPDGSFWPMTWEEQSKRPPE